MPGAEVETTKWHIPGHCTPDVQVKATCHQDCVKHCIVETKEKAHCPSEKSCEKPCAKPSEEGWGKVGAFIIWFLVIWAITIFFLWILKPSFILNDKHGHGGHGGNKGGDGGHGGHGGKDNDCEINWGKLLLASALIALGIMILVWLFKSLSK